ncbi:hypothetical protein METBIDRAFT_33419 [Metschnikowia bicuspidata var. bicuspidata NRRL YB-4993]|uniref:DNA/RNA-binding domain-containing protein n=1 Tax=Metschnikowia bicuspidata var. bicuspidata NRRL YB-4993 TaxID=869754 RepID=A0A1A0H5N2_9ASCO|nr:hypothetical protein METBIDRAFT_33419 [Metschnikowia bicuspidata var. bicuspidata NRRL YB-4993]OBA19212.1 hypothetical protein METBIDRAFT_33419 [Metschnikowia bicuspidata var. bicuspidata NRRL YB-4993]
MSDLGTTYANPLIPQKYLQEFDIVVPTAKNETLYESFHSTLSYITFLCLVGLGNVSRNSAQIRLSYVQPCKSVNAHYKHIQKLNDDKSKGKSLYIFPLLCYSKCIGLLPTMHEPYNHIGVIYNSLGQKFSAVLWFLRSQFTRDLSFAVGKRNLVSAFTKPWLEEAYDQAIRKSPQSIEPADVNNILLRIIAEYFYPSAFRKRLYMEKAESDFLNIVFSEPYYERYVKNTNMIAEHLTVFICFYELAVQSQQPSNPEKFGGFVCRYITAYLTTLKPQSFGPSNAEIPLKNIRLILAFFRKSQIIKSCGQKFLSSLVDAFNALQDFDEELRSKTIDAFVDGKAPIRSHYFSEDIHFKDFTPIGCQFKDFDDSHLFLSGNVHLLFGSSFYEDDQGMTELLDNEAVLRINKVVELASGDKCYRDKVVAAECLRSENILRLQASVVLARRIFGSRIHLDSERERFEVEKLHVPKTQQSDYAPARPKKNKNKQAERSKQPVKSDSLKTADQRSLLPTLSEQETDKPSFKALPSSMGEIELMILGHAPKLITKRQELETDVGLADMVSAIVSEDETRENSTAAGDGTQNATNEAISKSTESSRVGSNRLLNHTQFVYPDSRQGLQQPSQQSVHLEDSSQAATFDRAAYQNSQMGYAQQFHASQENLAAQSPFMQQYSQYYMGFNAGQLPPVASYTGNIPPSTAFHSMPLPQQNGAFYPGIPPFQSSQPMAPTPANSYGMFAPPHYMIAQYPPNMPPQYPPNMPSQDDQKKDKPSTQGAYSMYPQYFNQ